MPSVSWLYPQEAEVKRAARRSRPTASPVATRWRSSPFNFGYAIEGDSRAVAARPTPMTTGGKVYIEFSPGIVQGEMPPLFIVGSDGNARARELSRSRQLHDSLTGCSPPPSCDSVRPTASSGSGSSAPTGSRRRERHPKRRRQHAAYWGRLRWGGGDAAARRGTARHTALPQGADGPRPRGRDRHCRRAVAARRASRHCIAEIGWRDTLSRQMAGRIAA